MLLYSGTNGERKQAGVLVPDDRGPQILHACCTCWYKVQIRAMLTDTSLYEECAQMWLQAR